MYASPQSVLCRQAAEDAVSLFSHAQNFRNVTLEALPQLLEAEEDIWLLAFVREGAVSDQQEECQSAVRHLMNVTQEVGDMVKVGLATLSDDDLSNVESVAGVPRDDISGCVSDSCAGCLRASRLQRACHLQLGVSERCRAACPFLCQRIRTIV